MSKYFMLFKNTLQERLIYRFETFMSFLSEMLIFLMFFYLWTSIYQEGGQIGSYSLGGMISYYFISRFLLLTTAGSTVAWMVGDEIRLGSMNVFLLQPISYFGYVFAYVFGRSFYNTFVFGFIFGILYLFINKYLSFSFEGLTFLFFILSSFLGFLIQFYFFYIVGLSAFWFGLIKGLNFSLATIILLLQGSLVPLDLMPSYFQKITDYLPFKYVIFVPISILTKKTEISWKNIIIPILWIILFIFLSKLIFKKGIKKYEGFGV